MTAKRLLLYAVLVLVAISLVSVLYARHEAARLRTLGDETQRAIARLTRDNDRKMQQVTRYLAGAAARDAQEALTAVSQRDWSAAGKALGDVRDVVGILQDVALAPDQSTVASCRAAVQRAQTAVAEMNQADAAKAIGEVLGGLGLLPRSEQR